MAAKIESKTKGWKKKISVGGKRSFLKRERERERERERDAMRSQMKRKKFKFPEKKRGGKRSTSTRDEQIQ